VALVGFTWLGLGTFSESLNPYVTFAEAREATDRTVQVTGDLPVSHLSWYSDDASRNFHFYMVSPEEGDSLEVVFEGVKPATFDDATGIVAVGSWDGDRFQARQILTKCPSKYEGEDPSEHQIEGGEEIPPPGTWSPLGAWSPPGD